jgi:hypothetical protein
LDCLREMLNGNVRGLRASGLAWSVWGVNVNPTYHSLAVWDRQSTSSAFYSQVKPDCSIRGDRNANCKCSEGYHPWTRESKADHRRGLCLRIKQAQLAELRRLGPRTRSRDGPRTASCARSLARHAPPGHRGSGNGGATATSQPRCEPRLAADAVRVGSRSSPPAPCRRATPFCDGVYRRVDSGAVQCRTVSPGSLLPRNANSDVVA